MAVPQDPVFLPDGTSFKDNLDPFGASTDDEARAVLETVDLWALVEDRGGISAGLTADSPIPGTEAAVQPRARRPQEGALSWQRPQKKSPHLDDQEKQMGETKQHGGGGGIPLLDEVSSSVDQDTDRVMQDTDRVMQAIIMHEFAGCTIVMVSHRLDMVVSSFDTVVVMDKGHIVERGRPTDLVASEGSRFRDLWLVQNKE